jgi:POT family proton-dependent oligopeptide transporter
MSANAPAASRWPRQIKYIVGNEACERFSYYGMKGILAGYITGAVMKGGLGQSADYSTEAISLFVSANYFMPLFGAWLSDKVIGRYHTILWVSLFYCAGHGVLAFSDYAGGIHGKMICLCTGLALIAFGSGGIKPCVSAFMGDQFKPAQSHLLQKAYGAFYWAINFGSFFSFLVIPWIKNHHGYSLAFAVPGILMAMATFVFWLGTKHYVRVPTNRQLQHAGFFTVFWNAFRAGPQFRFAALQNLVVTIGLPVLAMTLMTILGFSHRTGGSAQFLGWTALACIGVWYLLVLVLSLLRKTELPEAFWAKAAGRHEEKEISGARSFTPILFIFAFVPIFWTLFDQTNSTWVLQGQKMVPANLLGLTIGAEEMQSMNPLLVMLLVPLFTLGVYPRLGRFASPLKRMSCGMFVAAGSYLVVAAIQRQIEAGGQLSVLWQTIPYLTLTAAEVLFSTTGLEFAFREAAPELKSTIMSFWLLTISMGDLFVVTVTKLFARAADQAASVSPGRFLQYAGMTFVVAVLFSLVAAFYQYRDKAAAEGK